MKLRRVISNVHEIVDVGHVNLYLIIRHYLNSVQVNPMVAFCFIYFSDHMVASFDGVHQVAENFIGIDVQFYHDSS